MAPIGKMLKPYLPKSLFWRAFLILVLPIILLQLVVALVFIQRHYDGVTAQMAGSIARELNFAAREVNSAETVEAARRRLSDMVGPFAFQFGIDEGSEMFRRTEREFFDLTGSVIAETMREELEMPFALDLVTYSKQVDVRLMTNKGVMRVLVPRRRMNAANPHLLLVWMSATAIALIGVAAIFLNNQIRPIRELARTAMAFGRGQSLSFRPSGADEVRRAGHAFLDMRGRIERQMEQRTRMLSGVSHDLRTPLTRMRLALAVSPETEETRELNRDVREMETMLEAFLDFARGEEKENWIEISPVELAEEIAADARRQGGNVVVYAEIETPQKPNLTLRRMSMKRALANLVTNAMTYGGRVLLTTRLTPRYAEFIVEDDGPGIPEDKREEVLRPFARLDEARNQNVASGVGLGLSIAVDAVRGHGGSLKLDDSAELGGLRARIVLPR